MTPLDRARNSWGWLRAHPTVADGALALGVFTVMLCVAMMNPYGPAAQHGPMVWSTRTPGALSLVLMPLAAATLAFRRRAPLPVLWVTGLLSFVELLFSEPRAPVAMAAVCALYTVAARTDRPTAWRVGLLTMTALTGAAMLAGPMPWYTQENLGIFAWTGMAAAAGDAVRSRRAFVDAIRERAERAERTREEEARRRVAEERLRIARDLHDVVAHHIALVNVQAGVAAHLMDRRPDQAKEALAHVREASRSALGELRATVGLLRQSGDPEAPVEPTSGLDRLEELADTFRHAGLRVEVARGDQGSRPPAAVDLAAYRIIQEALTNVRKHAGGRARAEVSVVRVGPHIEVTVLDDGSRAARAEAAADPTTPPDPALPSQAGPDRSDQRTRPDPSGHQDQPGGGHGLLGMRERATALGGVLTAGPRYGGGFRVHAILPVKTRTGRGAGETEEPP
ncbi:sensor histidine kinase [Streptomyces sp. NPDC059578]|uniref:sensor histidine kinase n=1 Tax=unclassified Streptomyces TaxID=2593676 RepID=UPI003649BE61